MKNLSSPTELQQAIDGNRREGRRAGYESYNMFTAGALPPRPQVPLPPTSIPGLPQLSPLPPGGLGGRPGPPPPFNGNFPGNITSKLAKQIKIIRFK